MASHLIAFFGPDGTGKSTHVELLLNYFQSHKTRVKKAWIRSPHTLAYLLSCFFVKMGFYRIVSNPFGREKKYPAVHIDKRLRRLWSLIELVSVIPVIIFRVYAPLLLGYIVVAERYVVDTLVTIAYYTNDLGFLQSLTARLLLCSIPKNTLFIHLDSDYSTLLKRRGHKVEAYDFIEFQKMGYKMLGNLVGATLIDTSNITIEQTFTRIVSQPQIGQVLQSRT